MNCEICGREVQGDIELTEQEVGSAVWLLMTSTPDRDWISCDSCGKLVCHNCCEHPKSGYCDRCIAKYNLLEELNLVENCPIEELEDFMKAKQGRGHRP